MAHFAVVLREESVPVLFAARVSLNGAVGTSLVVRHTRVEEVACHAMEWDTMEVERSGV